MRVFNNKTKLILGLLFVSSVFIVLRLKTLNHLLMYDEARNIISFRAFFSGNKADPFYWNYFFHPPLYTIFASALSLFRTGIDLRLELLSLSFSYLTLLVIYVLSARIGGLGYAFLSGLFLSLMPASIAYDTWIKRDGLASALGYLAILLLLRRRFLWCAVALSFSLLAKENALFFIMAATVIISVSSETQKPKKIAVIYGTIFILTSWWYLFFSSMPESLFDIYLSAEKNASTWGNSPFYYFRRLLPDMGLPISILFAIGSVYILYLALRKKQYGYLPPAIVILCVYMVSSMVILAKTPWLSLSAVPALAMVAGCGAIFLVKGAKKYKFFPAVFAPLLMTSLLGGAFFSYEKYHADSYPKGWAGASYSKELALYLNRVTKNGERLMITQFSYWGLPLCSGCPIFLYYLEGRPIYEIDGRNSPDDVLRMIADNRISWLVVIDSNDERCNFHALANGLKEYVPGASISVGCSYVWKMDDYRPLLLTKSKN